METRKVIGCILLIIALAVFLCSIFGLPSKRKLAAKIVAYIIAVCGALVLFV